MLVVVLVVLVGVVMVVVVVLGLGKSRKILPLFRHQSLLNNGAGPDAAAATGLSSRVMDEPRLATAEPPSAHM